MYGGAMVMSRKAVQSKSLKNSDFVRSEFGLREINVRLERTGSSSPSSRGKAPGVDSSSCRTLELNRTPREVTKMKGDENGTL